MIFKPAFYFGRQVPGGGFGKIFGLTGIVLPVGPGLITDWSAVPGGIGEIDITIGALPSAGDGATAGDGLGTITALQYQIDNGAWVGLGTSPLTTTLTGFGSGQVVLLRVRALGYLGRSGSVASATVSAGGDALTLEALIDGASGEPLIDATSGEPLMGYV